MRSAHISKRTRSRRSHSTRDRQLRLEMLLAEAENNTFKRVKWQQNFRCSECTDLADTAFLRSPMSCVQFEDGINELQTLGQSVRTLTEANHRAAQHAGDLLRDLRQVSHRSTQTANQLYTSNGKIGHSINYQAAWEAYLEQFDHLAHVVGFRIADKPVCLGHRQSQYRQCRHRGL